MSTNVNGLSNTSCGEKRRKRSHQNRFTVAVSVFQFVSAEREGQRPRTRIHRETRGRHKSQSALELNRKGGRDRRCKDNSSAKRFSSSLITGLGVSAGSALGRRKEGKRPSPGLAYSVRSAGEGRPPRSRCFRYHPAIV